MLPCSQLSSRGGCQQRGSFGAIFIPCHFSSCFFLLFLYSQGCGSLLNYSHPHGEQTGAHTYTHHDETVMRERERAWHGKLIHPNDKDHYGDKEGRETTHFILIRPESALLGTGKESDQVAASWKMPPPGSPRAWPPERRRHQADGSQTRVPHGSLGGGELQEGYEFFQKM